MAQRFQPDDPSDLQIGPYVDYSRVLRDCEDRETLAAWRRCIEQDDELSPRTKRLLELIYQRNERRIVAPAQEVKTD